MLDVIGMRAFAERAHRELLATGETMVERSVKPLTTLTALAQLGHDDEPTQPRA